MKYLENEVLETLANEMEEAASDCILEFRFELYSCKMITVEKRRYKGFRDSFSKDPNLEIYHKLSPPTQEEVVPHSGAPDEEANADRCDTVSNKTLFYLIETLNSSFTDYAFFNTTGSNFAQFTLQSCAETIDTRLNLVVNGYNTFKGTMWAAINSAIDLRSSSIYSYLANGSGQPYSERGVIWSINFMFYNSFMNRMLFFSCRAFNPLTEGITSATDESYFSDVDD